MALRNRKSSSAPFLEDNNNVFNLCCRLYTAYEHKDFLDASQYGANLIKELNK